jgi:hypothetical protein
MARDSWFDVATWPFRLNKRASMVDPGSPKMQFDVAGNRQALVDSGETGTP